jgi:hypothetical protein
MSVRAKLARAALLTCFVVLLAFPFVWMSITAL